MMNIKNQIIIILLSILVIDFASAEKVVVDINQITSIAVSIHIIEIIFGLYLSLNTPHPISFIAYIIPTNVQL